MTSRRHARLAPTSFVGFRSRYSIRSIGVFTLAVAVVVWSTIVLPRELKRRSFEEFAKSSDDLVGLLRSTILNDLAPFPPVEHTADDIGTIPGVSAGVDVWRIPGSDSEIVLFYSSQKNGVRCDSACFIEEPIWRDPADVTLGVDMETGATNLEPILFDESNHMQSASELREE